MLTNSAMVLGSGTWVTPDVAIWACNVVWPLLTDEGTSSSWSFFSKLRLPVPPGTANVGLVIVSNVACTLDWYGPVTVPFRWPVIVIGMSLTVVLSNAFGTRVRLTGVSL